MTKLRNFIWIVRCRLICWLAGKNGVAINVNLDPQRGLVINLGRPHYYRNVTVSRGFTFEGQAND
jgi:hypothetical protein